MNAKQVFVAVIAAAVLVTAAACSGTRTRTSTGERTDDAVILSSVKSALIAERRTDAHEINVEVYRGVVQLNGFVDTQDEKSRATIVATEVEGVKQVQNNLQLSKPNTTAGDHFDDSMLTAKVKAALIASPDTKAHQISVETSNGVVQLSGFVNNETAKSAATTVAMSVTGVKSVSNKIDIKSY
jgi:hyperosmotically inducible protein